MECKVRHEGKVGWIWSEQIGIEQRRAEQILKRDWICGTEQMKIGAVRDKSEPKLVDSGANWNQRRKPNQSKLESN